MPKNTRENRLDSKQTSPTCTHRTVWWRSTRLYGVYNRQSTWPDRKPEKQPSTRRYGGIPPDSTVQRKNSEQGPNHHYPTEYRTRSTGRYGVQNRTPKRPRTGHCNPEHQTVRCRGTGRYGVLKKQSPRPGKPSRESPKQLKLKPNHTKLGECLDKHLRNIFPVDHDQIQEESEGNLTNKEKLEKGRRTQTTQKQLKRKPN